MKNFAFTLSEILITLGIIGVVAAMTIPNLISNYQKRSTAIQLKKTYSTIAQAVRKSEVDNDGVAGWDMSPNRDIIDIFDQYIAPYLKCSKKLIGANNVVYLLPNGKETHDFVVTQRGAAIYTLLSGVQILLYKGKSTSSEGINLLIDLNGYNTKPNRIGRDIFSISVFPKVGAVMFYSKPGEDGTTQRTRNELRQGHMYSCNKDNYGSWCGALIQADGWQISNDYPW